MFSVLSQNFSHFAKLLATTKLLAQCELGKYYAELTLIVRTLIVQNNKISTG